MRKTRSQNSITDAFDNAYYEVSVLSDEMREAFENTPEQFKENSGREREVTADYLEAVFNPSLPSSISGNSHFIFWEEKVAGRDGKIFRPARRDNIVNCLEAGLRYALKAGDSSDEMVRFVEQLKIDIHNLKSLHFPGMSGR